MTGPTDRYDVTRSNGREVEIVRGLDLRRAQRIVERDRNAGFTSYLAPARAPRRTYR